MAEDKQFIARVRLTDGTTVEVKDEEARNLLNSLFTDTVIFDCGTYTDDTGVTE